MQIDEYDHIKYLANLIASRLKPLKIYLFGSFAEQKNTFDSDYDLYVVISDDDRRNLIDLITEAQRAVRHLKKRAVDVLVNRVSTFEEMKNIPFAVENDVAQKGIVVYE